MAEPHEHARPPGTDEPGLVGPGFGDGGERGVGHGGTQPAAMLGQVPEQAGDGRLDGMPGGPGTGGTGERLRAPQRNPVPPVEPSRRALGFELAAMFVLAFAVPIFGLVVELVGGARAQPTQQVPPSMYLVVTLVGLGFQWVPVAVLYFLLRRRGGWSSIGLTRLDGIDVTAGVMLWVASHFTVFVLGVLTQGLGRNDVDFLPEGLPVWQLAVVSLGIAATAGIVEEILARGYGQTRLEQLGAPGLVIVLVPTALWALLHLYQGVSPAVVIFGLGMLYAVWFHRTRRLWPLIIAHTLFDLTVLVLLIVTML